MSLALRRSVVAVLALSFSFAMSGLPRSALAADPVLLTIANTNRGKMDPFQDGFLAYHEKGFERALSLTLKDLGSLPQREITALGSAETWSRPVILKGPLLMDVLALAGANTKHVTIFALDGYGAAFDANLLSSREWVLAHTMNGRPLAIGGRGPLWLAYETGEKPASAEEEAKWVWSVFYIEVGKK